MDRIGGLLRRRERSLSTLMHWGKATVWPQKEGSCP